MDALLLSLVATGFTVAFLHAALPTHWLPFVLVGRVQGWSTPRTLGVVGLAGAAHIGLTALLGLILTAVGRALDQRVAGALPWVAGAVLIGLGLFYIWRAWKGRIHGHGAPGRTPVSDQAAVWGLVAVLAVSPCEAFLPIYLSGATFGAFGFVALSVTLAVGTMAGMLGFTALALLGASRLKLASLARYEGAVMGSALLALGFGVLWLHP